MDQPLIILDNITIRLRDRWFLNDTSWRITRGEQWAVVGSNGAGKSTLVKAVAGRVPVVKGRVVRHFNQKRALHHSIGYVSSEQRREIVKRERQVDFSRDFSGKTDPITTEQFLYEDLDQKGYGQGNVDSISPKRFGLTGVEELLKRPLISLSTGEMGKVLIARALRHRPELLILDEPFDGLDASASRELGRMLQKMVEKGLQILLVTNRKEEIQPFVTHTLIIEDGKIAAKGKKEDILYSAPSAPFKAPEDMYFPGGDLQPSTKDAKNEEINDFPLVKMDNVVVRYGETIALDRFNWCVRDGENWAIKGPNGAGKSTILKLITADALQAYANEIYLFGKKRGTGESIWDIKKRIGMVSHDFHSGYLKSISALNVVCSGFFDSIGLYRYCSQDQVKAAKELMFALDIHMLSNQWFDMLSYGRRQMVLMARAMIKSPLLLILDEPCTGLDHTNRRKILSMIDYIGSHTPTNIIFVSHHESEIPKCITNELLLDKGKIVKVSRRLSEDAGV